VTLLPNLRGLSGAKLSVSHRHFPSRTSPDHSAIDNKATSGEGYLSMPEK